MDKGQLVVFLLIGTALLLAVEAQKSRKGGPSATPTTTVAAPTTTVAAPTTTVAAGTTTVTAGTTTVAAGTTTVAAGTTTVATSLNTTGSSNITATPRPDRIGRGPDDPNLCQLVKYNRNGREKKPDFLAICDRDAVKYCIFKQWICDGEQDCFDNQDETDCPKDDIVDEAKKPRKSRKRQYE